MPGNLLSKLITGIFLTAVAFGLLRLLGEKTSDSAFEKKALRTGQSLALAFRVSETERHQLQAEENANAFLAHLVPDIETEKLFFIPNSPWHGTLQMPDNRWESTDPPGKALEAGENCFAVNREAVPPEKTPLLLTVTNPPESKRRRLIVIYADGSGDILKLEDHETFEPGSTTVLDRFPDVDWLLPLPPSAK